MVAGIGATVKICFEIFSGRGIGVITNLAEGRRDFVEQDPHPDEPALVDGTVW